MCDGERMLRAQHVGEQSVKTPDAADAGVLRKIAGSLAEFVAVLRSGETPSGEIRSNVYSLAMVEAAVRPADTGARVSVSDVLAEAQRAVLAAEMRDDVRAELEGSEALPPPASVLL
ncbi:hypothetical protein [Paramicrobacterium humi]|uniref:hypothetical protein n=1 Tax=Paramicrobacterium humi TaxID=640635 RepID=UPI00115FBC30|nr:hypothetical protein [Microbacterium humi]